MNLMVYLLDLQCAMCRAVLESGADQKTAESLNDGIVYLMIIPYVLGGLTLYFLYLKFFKKVNLWVCNFFLLLLLCNA